MDISRHPILKQATDVCHAIEKCGASIELTDAVILASALAEDIDKLLDDQQEYSVDGWNNFCTIFELPIEYPKGFCHGGGHRTNFQMVDFFNPLGDVFMAGCSKEVFRKEVGEIPVTKVTLKQLYDWLVGLLKDKEYVKKGREYLILFDFGASITFKK